MLSKANLEKFESELSSKILVLDFSLGNTHCIFWVHHILVPCYFLITLFTSGRAITGRTCCFFKSENTI